MAVRVVTDSTAYLHPGLARELDITVLPHHVEIDGQEYLDGVDLAYEDFHRMVYEQKLKPRTTPPTVTEFQRAYERLNKEAGEIITILLSGALSQAVEHAQIAADGLLGRCRIEVIDSKSVSAGLGILVELAGRAAEEDRALDETIRLVRGVIPQIYVVFFSDTLSYLEEAGRIGHAQALLGTYLGIKPFLTLEDGRITPIEKVRTREEALEKLIEFVVEFDAIKQLAIVKADITPDQETAFIIEELHKEFPDVEIPILSYGPVLASHIGLDTLGIIVHESYEI
jgi:DegV family protein with EDD domain